MNNFLDLVSKCQSSVSSRCRFGGDVNVHNSLQCANKLSNIRIYIFPVSS